MSNRVGAGSRGFTRTDRAMIEMCLTCTFPANKCRGGFGCSYSATYGDSSPKLLFQNVCGVRELSGIEVKQKGGL